MNIPLFEIYKDNVVRRTDEIVVLKVPNGQDYVYQLFSILVDRCDELISYLYDKSLMYSGYDD